MMTMKKIIFPLILLILTACSENKEAQPAEEATAVAIAENVTDSIQVDAITSATSKPNQVSFNGTMVIPPQRMATVSLTMGGVIKSTSLLPGEPVRQGSVLATLENPDFITLQQTYLDSHAQTEFLEAEFLRQQALSAEQAASQKKLQQSKADYLSMKSRVEAAAAQLKLLEVEPEVLLKEGIQPFLQIKAPISGYVADVKMNVGKYMNVGDALCEIVDKSRTLLRLTTYEKDLADMKVGNPVQFRVNGMGKTVFKATLISIGQKVDEDTRSVEVYARVDTVDSQFRPGMYVTARIMKEQASAEKKDSLSLKK
jgi:efflux transporter, RND family, MFP subunit